MSDPSHERYGNHLTEAEVNELVKPADKSIDLVHEWLMDNGIASANLDYSPAKDWISISLPIEEVENLLDTKYSTYKHDDGDYAVRTPDWSLPLHLHEHISVIQPTNSFFRTRKNAKGVKVVQPGFESKAPAVPANLSAVCDVENVTPDCLRSLYGTIDYTPKSAGKNKVGLNDFLGESNNRSDVKIFLETYRPDAVSAAYSFQVEIIAGGNNEQTQENQTELDDGKDLEGNLDAETIIGISYPTPLVAFTTGGSPPYIPDEYTTSDTNEPYLVWVNYVLAQSNLPQVISTSYDDDEQTVPLSYATAVCNSFAQLGARGITLLFSSGDDGVGADGYCVSNDGTNSSTFLPEFPSTCPYITSVGATKFIPEVVATDAGNGFVSGGGFSRYFPRPKYQDAVVPPYVKALNGAYPGLYNPAGRGYPDIAAQGYHFATIWNGTYAGLDGTSASAPTAAGVLTLVNDALISEGKSPLGFLNPWLYSGK